MNITLLEELCKKEGRKVFERFKDSVEDNPFGYVNENIIIDTLNFEINQEFGRGVLSKFTKTEKMNTSANIEVVNNLIGSYKKTIIQTSLFWVVKKYKIIIDLK